MFRRRESLLPPEQIQAEPEKTPEYSGETLRMVEEIDNSIEYSQSLLGGLDRLAREKIIADQEIDPHKEIGRLSLKNYDASEFEEASRGLQIRNLIHRNKYALKGREGLVDTRKIKEEAKGKEYSLNPDELKRLKKFGLNPKKINPEDFATTFIEGEKGEGAEKVILRRKTEQEMDKTAGDILEKQLKNLETNTGTELVKQKQGLEEFKKEIEQHKDVLSSEHLTRADNEYLERKELIGEKQENLNSNLEIIRSPLLEQREKLTQALENFSSLLKDTDGQKKVYQTEIKNLQEKITKISGTKQLKEVLGDEIKQWEQEKKQAEVNLKDFQKTKDSLNKRIIELKKSQTEVDAALERINNVGKTKAEKAEEEKKQREKQRREREYQREQRERASGARRPDIYSESEEETAFATEGSDSVQSRQANAPAEKSSGKNQSPKEPAGPKLRSGSNPPASAAETEQENKEYVVRKVSDWLDLLGLKNAVGTAKTAMENNFKVGEKKFDLTASMALDQIRLAYTKYIVDFRHGGRNSYLTEARKEANAKFEKIIKNLS